MNEVTKLIGCFVIAVGWVALPMSFLCWLDSIHQNVAKLVGLLIVCEIAFFTWVLYCKF